MYQNTIFSQQGKLRNIISRFRQFPAIFMILGGNSVKDEKFSNLASIYNPELHFAVSIFWI